MKGEEEKRKLADARVCARSDGITCDWFLLEFIHSKKRRGTSERKLRIWTQKLPAFWLFCEAFHGRFAGSWGGPDTAVPSVRAKCKTRARSMRNGFAQRKRAANELFSLTLLLSVIDNFC